MLMNVNLLYRQMILTDIEIKKLFYKTSNLKFCLYTFIFSRLIIFFGFLYAGHTLLGHSSFLSNFNHWDSGWYLSIARDGYSSSTDYTVYQNYVFFPLYPLLIKIVHQISGISLEVSGVLLSNFFFLLALYYFHELMLEYNFGIVKSRLGTLLLAFSPANIYFVSIYTESLFLVLSIMAILFAYRDQWIKASLSGFLLAASRPNGVLIILPILLILKQTFHLKKKWQISHISLILIPFGLFIYMFYLHKHVGNYLAFKEAEIAWGRTGWHLHTFWRQFKNFINHNNNIYFLILLIPPCYLLYKNKFYAELLLITVMIIPAIFSALSESLARYICTLFPFYTGWLFLLDHKRIAFFLIFGLFIFILGLNIFGWAGNFWLT